MRCKGSRFSRCAFSFEGLGFGLRGLGVWSVGISNLKARKNVNSQGYVAASVITACCLGSWHKLAFLQTYELDIQALQCPALCRLGLLGICGGHSHAHVFMPKIQELPDLHLSHGNTSQNASFQEAYFQKTYQRPNLLQMPVLWVASTTKMQKKENPDWQLEKEKTSKSQIL